MMSSNSMYEHLLKFILVGDTNTGKSCLLNFFLEKKFKEHSPHTVGVGFGSRIVSVGGERIKLQLWDTAGQERFRSVTRNYYRGASGCLLVYDITDRNSYNHLVSWLTDARSMGRSDVTIMLVGNKCDRDQEREVTLLEASRFAQENSNTVKNSLYPLKILSERPNLKDLLFMETSALTGECVDDVFLKCTNVIVQKLQNGVIDAHTLMNGVYGGFIFEKKKKADRSCIC